MYFYRVDVLKSQPPKYLLDDQFVEDNGWLYLACGEKEYFFVLPEEHSHQELSKKVQFLFGKDMELVRYEAFPQSSFIQQVGKEKIGQIGYFLLSDKLSPKQNILIPHHEYLEKLSSIIGLNEFKECIKNLVAYHDYANKQGIIPTPICYIFTGTRGTGKKYGVNTIEELFEKKAVWINATGIGDTKLKSNEFAVALHYQEGRTFKKKGILEVLMSEVGIKLSIFFASTNEKAEQLQKELSEFFYQVQVVHFPQYSKEELGKIALGLLEKRGLQVDKGDLFDYVFRRDDLKDSWEIRKFVEKVIALAIDKMGKQNQIDLLKISELFEVRQRESLLKDTVSEALETLNQMIGLEKVKSQLQGVLAYQRLEQLRKRRQLPVQEQLGHLIFSGSPGTGKTEVARLYAKILYDHQLISQNKLVEVGRADLIGEYVGQTAPKIKRIFDEAEGGVLFIDEAYSLIPQSERDFATEAIPALIQEMENRRDRVLVIFAGYPELMREFIDTNPGLKSRISREIMFEDYNPEELLAIFECYLSRQQYSCSGICLEFLLNHFSSLVGQENLGNGRYVRQIFEGAIYHQAKRLVAADQLEQSNPDLLLELSEGDIQASIADLNHKVPITRPIGFTIRN